MQFIYDVQVNWADGMLKSYLIPKYHEWYKDDEVELYTCLPVVKVSPELFSYIEQEYDRLPQYLLSLIYCKASKKEDGRTIEVEYAFVVTDGKRMIAVDTDSEDVPNYKSYLTPRNASYVEDLLYKLKLIETDWEPPSPSVLAKKDQLSADLLLLDEKYIQGLTRAERDLKSILMTYLYTLTTSSNSEEVRYWYSEVFPGTFHNEKVKRMRTNTMVQKMFDELKDGWGERHVELGNQFIKFNDLFKESWETQLKRQKREQDKVEK